MKSVKKILFVSANAKSLYNFRGDLIKEIKNKNHEVSAIIPKPKYSEQKELSNLDIHLKVIELQNNKINYLNDLIFLIKLYYYIKKHEPDKIIAYTLKPIIYTGLSLLFNKKQIEFYPFFTGIGSVFNSNKQFKLFILSKIVSFLLKISLLKSHKVLFQNKDNYIFFNKNISKLKNHEVILGSGVNLEKFKYSKYSNRNIIFIMIARLLKDKGIREYIYAANIIKQKFPKVCFKLIGPIENTFNSISLKEINKLIKNNSVEYLGEKKDVYKYLKDSSVCILPSYHEGLPRSILEAMAIGRPIITTNAPGCKETVLNGLNGFLIPIKDTDHLIKKIKYFINNPDKISIMGDESYKIVKQKFDINLINKQYLKAINL